MAMRFIFLTLMGIGLIGLSLVIWVAFHPAHPSHATAHPVPGKPPTATVLVASGDLEPGTLLTPKMVGAGPVPLDLRPGDALADTPEHRRFLTGALLKRGVGAGQPILGHDVVSPEDRGFAAAVLTPGTVAETISITPVTGDAGLIWPGDHVTVLLSLQNGADTTDRRYRIGARVVLDDVRVIAVNQHLAHAQPVKSEDGSGVHTATLEVRPEDAPRLAVAGHMGELSLVIHSAIAGSAITASAESDRGADSHSATFPLGAPENTPKNEPLNAPLTSFRTYWPGDVLPEAPEKYVVHVFAGQQDQKDYAQ